MEFQENNAICIVNLTSKSILDIYPMGTKDWNSHVFSLDASDRDGERMNGWVDEWMNEQLSDQDIIHQWMYQSINQSITQISTWANILINN